jgi:hypothetical protein
MTGLKTLRHSSDNSRPKILNRLLSDPDRAPQILAALLRGAGEAGVIRLTRDGRGRRAEVWVGDTWQDAGYSDTKWAYTLAADRKSLNDAVDADCGISTSVAVASKDWIKPRPMLDGRKAARHFYSNAHASHDLAQNSHGNPIDQSLRANAPSHYGDLHAAPSSRNLESLSWRSRRNALFA